jgi:alpha-tubulin suppressor-like RCC1 family protein
VRCFGNGSLGRLGYASENDLGDNETPATAGDLEIGGAVVQLAAGGDHSCVVLDKGAVRCWGSGIEGQLGYGNFDNIGDDETPAFAGDVNLGGLATQVVTGSLHTCALLDNGAVRCWGNNLSGQLGYGNTTSIGGVNTPAQVGDIPLGATATQLAAGRFHTCALLDTGNVRCWGNNFEGQLGYGNTLFIGDNETPETAGDVDLGGATVVQIGAGAAHTCALLDTGAVRCWGAAFFGRLGTGNEINIGDDETPAGLGDIVFF